ncbi:hypothetical protein G6F22_015159 [Rhizopus arrhizus]|nr:hypothetical protein G6F22_015159 [Rhizopus arrhizus]
MFDEITASSLVKIDLNGNKVMASEYDITPAGFDWSAVEDNPFFWPHAAQVPELEAYMDALRKSGDSVGACVDVVADNVPPGWGEPIYGKLDGELAAALMSINAVKGVEIGDGFASAAQKGTEHRDLLTPQGFASNHAGGILGGISTGQPVVASIVLKPTSSLRLPGPSLDTAGNVGEVGTTGRHDPCVGIRATPIAEAMVAMVLMDQALRHRAQSMADTRPTVWVSQPLIDAAIAPLRDRVQLRVTDTVTAWSPQQITERLASVDGAIITLNERIGAAQVADAAQLQRGRHPRQQHPGRAHRDHGRPRFRPADGHRAPHHRIRALAA